MSEMYVEDEQFSKLPLYVQESLRDVLDRIPRGWGKWLSFGEGWATIVADLNIAIRELVPNYEIYQVKEKFGTLRYYCGAYSPQPPECCDTFRTEVEKAFPRPVYTAPREDFQQHAQDVAAMWETHHADSAYTSAHQAWEAEGVAARELYAKHEDAIEALVRAAELATETTCETCSSREATTQNLSGWYTTICPACLADVTTK